MMAFLFCARGGCSLLLSNALCAYNMPLWLLGDNHVLLFL